MTRAPQVLTSQVGWQRQLSYCIAFSVDGATDVTRRYVRDAKHARQRDRASGPELLHIVNEIRNMRRQDMSSDGKRSLAREDVVEELELRGYIVQQVVVEALKLEPGGVQPREHMSATSKRSRRGTRGHEESRVVEQ